MKFYIMLIAVAYATIPLTCNEATKQSECQDVINGIYECIWHNDQCKLKTCDLLTSPCDNQAYEGQVCTSSGSTCKGVKNCSEIDNAKSCKLVQPFGQLCYWDNVCRVKSCQDNNQQECTITNGQQCVYMNQTCQPLGSCAEIKEVGACQSATSLNCIWVGELCTQASCTIIRDQELCSKTKTINGRCFNAVNNENGLSCLSCSALDTKCDCEYYTLLGCSWKNNVCGETTCANYLNEQECNSGQLGCTWYSPMKKCVTISDAEQYDRSCDIYSFGQILAVTIGLLYF